MSTSQAPGGTNLDVLIRSMQPELHEPTFVFASTTEPLDIAGLKPKLQFHEAEGLTVIVEQQVAIDSNLPHEFPCKMITLNVHSSLDAVGFLAKITSRLAALGMGVNPVSGFYHDHLFVPEGRADDALASLLAMTQEV